MDLTGGATPDQYQRCMDALAPLPDVHSVVVLICPLSGICPGSPVAQAVRSFAAETDKTVVMALLGGDELIAASKMLIRAGFYHPNLNSSNLVAGVPVFHHSDNATASVAGFAFFHWNC